MFFPKHALDKLGQKALRAFTVGCGYNRNMAYVINDRPSHLGDYSTSLGSTPIRLYLGVTTLSDIALADSMMSDPCMTTPTGKAGNSGANV
eukprot:13888639-Ditylum_brightwellii.AAC.1